MILRAREHCFEFSRQAPMVMGILNITPDSFSDGGKFLSEEKALFHCEKMIEDGAAIIDVGAESSRPGAAAISEDIECDRLLPIVKAITKRFSIPLSIDTKKAQVARQCLDAGAHLINDISGCLYDEKMIPVIASYRAGVIIMHMRGTPETMQESATYDDVVCEVKNELLICVQKVLDGGVEREYIAIDPGIGFAKSLDQSIALMRQLDELQQLCFPVVLGTSRKSFIGQVLKREVDERLAGSLATVAVGLQKGANIFRVHDVKETCDMIDMIQVLE